MQLTSAHEQVYAKVNVQVDQKIVKLVEALSAFPQLETLESCQDIGGHRSSWVCFRYGTNDWQDISKFVFGHLAPRLDQLVGDDISLSLRPSFGGVVADFSVRSGRLNSVINAIARIVDTHPLP